MKITDILRTCAFAAGLSALVWGSSCTKDPVETLEARLEVNTESISVSKRGVDKNGNEAYIRVTSNVYWTAAYAEDDYEWLTLSALAGDPGTTTISLTFKPNEDAVERHTTIRLETYDGAAKQIMVVQRGTGEVIILMNDGFAGDYNEGTPISKYIPMSEGVDAETINFSGTEAYISKENSSYGYEGASGGNNILLKGKDADLVVTGVNARRDQAFDISFGVWSATSFTTDDFVLQISKDSENWADVPYTISQSAEQHVTRADVTGWQMGLASFRIKEPVEEFFFRLKNVDDRDFRVDDIAVEEGSDTSPEIEFPGDEPGPGPGPSGEIYLEENFDWITEAFGGSDYFNGSKPTTEKGITVLAPENQAVWDACGFTSVSGKAYVRLGYIKIGTTSVAGDIVTPRITALTGPTDLILTFKAVSYNSTESDNTLKVNVLGAGTADITTLAISNFSYPNGVQTPEQNANWVEYTINITGADAGTQIQLQAGSSAKCRFFFDDFKIQGAGEPEVPVEGLPATWSFSATAVEDGLVNLGEYYYLSDDRAARLEAVRGALPSKAGTYKAAELIPETQEYNNRLLMYGFALNDAWQFSVPVKHLKAGTKLRLQTELSASAAGAKFYVLEYSIDNSTWTAVNTKIGSFGTTDGVTVAPHEITYTVMMPFAASANERCEVIEDFTVAEAIEEGTLYVRLRVCDALSNRLDKNILPANGGTNRVRRTMNSDGTPFSAATSISVAQGSTPEPTPTVTIGGVTGGKLTFAYDATEAKTFTVVSTGKDWTLNSTIDAWADVTPKSGKVGETVSVTVTPKAANTGAANTGTLTFTAGTVMQTIDVTQEAFMAEMDFGSVTGGVLSFDGASTAAKTFTVMANVAWTAATVADWFDFAPKSGAAGAEVTVTVTPKSTYNGQNARSADITFTAAGLSGEKVTVSQLPSGVDPAEGFPAMWSFPADGETAGYVNKAEWWYLSDDKAARIDAVRATNPSTAKNIPMSYTIDASDTQDRVLMYGMFLDDYWKFTVPVKHFKAGSKVNLSTTLSSSGTGARFFILEYSTDGTTWTAANTQTVTATVGGVEREVTCTAELQMPANTPCEVDQTVTIPTDIEDGTISLRLRVCDKSKLDGSGDMSAAHNGTNRMFQKRESVGGPATGRRIGVTLVSDGPAASKRR